jgi:hypothetical protein
VETVMTRRHLAWTIAAFLHLVLVICGAASVTLSGRNLALGILAQYSEVSGADTQYGFFAPAVASQCRAILTLRDAEGREWSDTIAADPAAGFGWRTSSAIDAIPRLPENLRRALAGSWAAVMFGRHPNAVEVVVDAQIELLPTMAEWNAGARPMWESFYSSTFVRKADSDDHGDRR